MYKCIYDLTTGKVIAICNPKQNLEVLMSNWTNVDYIEVGQLQVTTRNFNLSVDLATKELIIT